MARVDLQNAEGGINGRKIDLSVVDDQTNPTLTTTAVQRAISDGTLGIVANSPFFFEGAKYAQQAGVPVTGNSADGPEWGEQPYTNMFDAFRGSENPQEPVNSIYGNFLKSHGGTTIGSYGYGVSPLSAEEAKGAAESFQRAGGKVGVLDTSVPFGSVDFTSQALVAEQKHVDALLPTLDDDSNFALVTALKQAGVKLKAVLLGTGYEPSVVHSPVWSSLQGTYFLSLARPFSLPNAGTEQMAAALGKYAAFTKGRIPQLRSGLVVARLRPHDQGNCNPDRIRAGRGSSRRCGASSPTTATVCSRSTSTTRQCSVTTSPSVPGSCKPRSQASCRSRPSQYAEQTTRARAEASP